jgi:chaperone modulatory protein CbpM
MKENLMKKNLDDVCKESGIRRELILSFVEKQWIHSGEEAGWQDEDVRRAHLIVELQHDLGVNDEAVPIILHLIDQLHAMQRVLRRLDLENVAELSIHARTTQTRNGQTQNGKSRTGRA